MISETHFTTTPQIGIPMADLTITPAHVGLGNQETETQLVQVGEAVVAGQTVFSDTTDFKHYLADCDAAGEDDVKGITLGAAAADGYVLIARSKGVKLSAVLTVGESYYLSATAGGIRPVGDLTTGDKVTFLGIATSTSVLELAISASGAVHA